MISTSNTSGPRTARPATSVWGVAQPEPMKTRMPLRICPTASSAVVHRDEFPVFNDAFGLFIVMHNHRLSIGFGHTFFGRSSPTDGPDEAVTLDRCGHHLR